jgi:outer membrane protein assembly factor BamA
LEIDVVSSRVDSLFAIILENPRNSFLKASFLPHTTALSKLTFAYAPNQPRGKYLSVQTGLEMAGNLIDAYNRTNSKQSRPYTLFGQRYFHYIKLDGELRRGQTLRKDSRLAYRIGGGVGVPLANSTTLPLEKRYFGGGSNSLRAWQARTLGPGTYTRSLLDPDQFGDVRLEANIEIRQPLFGVFESAFFVDAGNIWTLNDNSSKGAASNFKTATVLRDLALGTGAGLRLNFELFIVRLDLGLKLYDPSISPAIGTRWSISTWGQAEWENAYSKVTGSQYQRLNLNLGIGYPF